MVGAMQVKRYWHVLAFLVVTLALCGPAIWNGYPFIYYDTEDYVNMSFMWDPPLWRTLPYALITVLARPFGSLWVVVAVQALCSAWVLHETVCGFVPRRKLSAFLGIAAGLILFTGLPWVTSEIMPDAWTAIVPLGMATLAFGDGLPLWRRLLVGFLVFVALIVHMSHLAVAGGLVLVLLAMWGLAPRLKAWRRPALGLAIGSLLLSTAAVPVVHGLATGSYFFTRAGSVLQLALFVQNGLAKRYLDSVCPQGAHLKLCPARDKLPDSADAFLWAPWASPFWSLGGWGPMRAEADIIVTGIVERYPAALAKAAWDNTVEQLRDVAVGDGLGPKRRPGWAGYYYDTAKARYPQEFASYMAARQESVAGIDFTRLNSYLVPVGWALQLGLLLLIALAIRGGDKRAAGLGMVVGLALLGNAFICGAISNPHDRYQNRIIPAAAAAGALIVVRWRLSAAARATAAAAVMATAAAPVRIAPPAGRLAPQNASEMAGGE